MLCEGEAKPGVHHRQALGGQTAGPLVGQDASGLAAALLPERRRVVVAQPLDRPQVWVSAQRVSLLDQPQQVELPFVGGDVQERADALDEVEDLVAVLQLLPRDPNVIRRRERAERILRLRGDLGSQP